MTAIVAERYGWRASCFVWAALHVAIALPVNLVLIPSRAQNASGLSRSAADRSAADAEQPFRWTRENTRAFVLLAFFAAMTAFVTSAMAAHLPGLLISVFAMLHGAGNGMITIAKGTLPLAIFGAVGYGERQGLLGVLGRGMQTFAPFAFGVVLERRGASAAIALSVTLSLTALAALMSLRMTRRQLEA